MTTRATSGFERRLAERSDELAIALEGLYGAESEGVFDRIVDRVGAAHATRSRALRRLDKTRTTSPDWYQRPGRVGYMAYVDRFGGTLAGVRARLPYLTELGVDMLHLLSLFEPRRGDNDGGYAIRDYLKPDPALGSMDDLEALVADLHDNGISLCADFVLNHTSDDHRWAVAAREGSEYHQGLYIFVDDPAEIAAWESTLPEVFPNLAPGNFTHVDELERSVWTTFHDFQWDLNWANPDVMVEMCDIALGLANLGVDVLRLDAIAFTWKRHGTSSQNQPEAHLIAQALRAVLAVAAPATVLLAEAIVGPDDLVGYLGRHELERRECHLAYHNQLMVQGWSMLATGETDLARIALRRLPDPPTSTTWFNYVRCHDDIGWAIDDGDASAAGVSGLGHRAFLAAFHRGDFPGSYAAGTPFATNPITGDERTCGMAATLAGVAAAEAAGDPVALEIGIRRLLLLYSIAFGYGGVPVIYMGDELAQLDASAAAATMPDDTRWVHRPEFDDELAARRGDIETTAGRLWAGMRRLVEARRSCRTLHGAAVTQPFDCGSSQVFAWHRRHAVFGDFVGLANVATSTQVVGTDLLDRLRSSSGSSGIVDRLSKDGAHSDEVGSGDLGVLAPLQVRWITAANEHRPIPEPPPPR